VEGEREVAWADQMPSDGQPLVDTDKPLLDHILKFPALNCKLFRIVLVFSLQFRKQLSFILHILFILT
jgi:hypothetical protein